MADDLQWSGSWRRLGSDDSMGVVSRVAVATGNGPGAPGPAAVPRATAFQSESVQVDAKQLQPKGSDPTVRPTGRVRMTRT